MGNVYYQIQFSKETLLLLNLVTQKKFTLELQRGRLKIPLQQILYSRNITLMTQNCLKNTGKSKRVTLSQK